MEQDAYTAGQQDFNLPHDVIQLPSGGIFYKSKKKTVKVGYLTAIDENIIAEADFKKSIQESIILPLLRNKLYERDLRPEEMIDGDIEAILIFLRNTSFGPDYSLMINDPATGEKFNATILLDELNIKQPKNTPNEEGLFEIELPVSKSRVKLKEKGSTAKIIAKIEMPEALTNIRDIIISSDAIMIARGDLGVELPVEKIPLIQKELIRKCIHRAKPVIVATQMMESMIDRVKPNRSEITDVANAVIEGADAVMLSGETATGQFPVLVIETMRKIISEVEENGYKYNRSEDLKPQPHSPSFLSDAVCYNASKLSEDSNANALVGMTQSGYTAFMLSSFRPQSPLFIFTKKKSLVNQLSLSWGVKAFYYDKEESLDEIIKDQIQVLKAQGFVNTGDVVVNTGSTPIQLHLPTNMIKINKVD